MKKILFSLLAVSAIGFMALKPVTVDPLPIGSSLPKASASMTDINGKAITLEKAKKANGLLVIFSCNTCPYVIKNQERNNAICEYASKKDIGVVIINSNEAQREGADSPAEMKTYADAQKYKWTYAIDKDSEIADAFGATRTPETFLFDKNSKLVYSGAIDDSPSDAAKISRPHLQAAIDDLMANRAVSVPTSKSVGCTIKRKK